MMMTELKCFQLSTIFNYPSTMSCEKSLILLSNGSFFFFFEKEGREIMSFPFLRECLFFSSQTLLKPLPHSSTVQVSLLYKYTNREERQIDQIISETYRSRQTDISREEESRGIVGW